VRGFRTSCIAWLIDCAKLFASSSLSAISISY
jgi:hypothetical protein